MKTARCIFSLVLLALLAACAETPLLDVREIDGVPVLMQNGMPFFTRLSRTDHAGLDLGGKWKFVTDPRDQGLREQWYDPQAGDEGWDDIAVPGAWNTQDPRWKDYVGVGWYRRTFTVPAEWKGRFNRLIIDGANYNCRVWINGARIGYHRGGFATFSSDASSSLRYGAENIIVIRIDNKRNFDSLPPLSAKRAPLGWWPWGGLTRGVSLESGPQTTLCKLAVDTDHQGGVEGSGVVYRHGRTEANAVVTVRLLDLAGQELKLLLEWPVTIGPTGIAVFRFKKTLEGARPWSPQTPDNRYLVEVEIKDPEGTEKQAAEIGFRTFAFRDGRAWLNGRPLFLRGVNRHEDDPVTGPWQSDARIAEDLDLIGRLHANFVRGAHYPADPRWLDACDRRGVLMMTEVPFNEVARSWKSLRAVEEPEFRRQAALALIEMIERDRNHPALVVWGMGNGNMTLFPSVKKMFADLYAVAKRFDPRRPAVFAMWNLPFGLTSLLDSSGEIGDAVFINEYCGWYYGRPEDAGLLIDQLRRRWPRQAIVVSETGAGAVPGRPAGKSEKVWLWYRRDFTEGYQAEFFRRKLGVLRGRPGLAGVCAWALADFPDDKPARGPAPERNVMGLCTRDRRPKLAFGALAALYAEIERQEEPGRVKNPAPP